MLGVAVDKYIYYIDKFINNNARDCLALIEGINGSGKSTLSSEFINRCINKNIRVKTYRGWTFHPVDLQHISVMSEREYVFFRSLCLHCCMTPLEWSSLKSSIEENCIYRNNQYLIAYTKIKAMGSLNFKIAYDYAFRHELYNGFSNIENFQSMHLCNWNNAAFQLADNSDTIHIFEAVFFQYPMMEFVGFHNIEKVKLLDYYRQIYDIILPLNPSIFYISVSDIDAAINRIAYERVGEDMSWIDKCCLWFEHTSYAKHKNLSGIKGIIEFCKERQQIELEIIQKLNIPNYIIKR